MPQDSSEPPSAAELSPSGSSASSAAAAPGATGAPHHLFELLLQLLLLVLRQRRAGSRRRDQVPLRLGRRACSGNTHVTLTHTQQTAAVTKPCKWLKEGSASQLLRMQHVMNLDPGTD